MIKQHLTINRSIELHDNNDNDMFSVRAPATLPTTLSSNVSEDDFAHKYSSLSVSRNAHRQYKVTFSSLPRMQHENNASLSATNKTIFCLKSTKRNYIYITVNQRQ